MDDDYYDDFPEYQNEFGAFERAGGFVAQSKLIKKDLFEKFEDGVNQFVRSNNLVNIPPIYMKHIDYFYLKNIEYLVYAYNCFENQTLSLNLFRNNVPKVNNNKIALFRYCRLWIHLFNSVEFNN